ncbi:hypothetical protein SLS62_010182 [Diatrype stigma]|uniref:Uncharacterized protein n=1 Tax=Diatrype stigma TaxID=117547 RepID=A0AAN9YIR3_9PEZI
MAFLLDPNISTADVYTTLSHLWIEHDQVTVQWEKTDLRVLPEDVAKHKNYYFVRKSFPSKDCYRTYSIENDCVGFLNVTRRTICSRYRLRETDGLKGIKLVVVFKFPTPNCE